MHGLLPLRGKPTENIPTRSLSGSQRSGYLRVHAVVYQDYTFKLQPVIWEADEEFKEWLRFSRQEQKLEGRSLALVTDNLLVDIETDSEFDHKQECLSATLQVAVKTVCVLPSLTSVLQ